MNMEHVRPGTSNVPYVEIRGMSKTFGQTRALREVDLDIVGGTIHALCGQNGSGKSTIIKVLAGYHEPDAGSLVRIEGEQVDLPIQPGLGIRVVHQDLGLALALSVLDNLYINGYPLNSFGFIEWKVARRKAAQLIARFHLDVTLDTLVSDLNPAQRAMLAIARAMNSDGKEETRLLILDEPTAHLPRVDVDLMMSAVKTARDEGVAILMVTHRLDEVLEHADCATVFRDGANVGQLAGSGLEHDALVEMILGRKLNNQYPAVGQVDREPLLVLREFSTGVAERVNLTVHRGEILGVTGLVGSGFEDVPYGLFAAAHSDGVVTYLGEDVRWNCPQDAISAGIALVPAERIGQGGVAEATLRENVTLPSLLRRRRGPFIDRLREVEFASSVLRDYDVRPQGDIDRPLASLSGGNQQKVLLAKWLEMSPQVLLLHEPTQGVDIGSRRQIFELLVNAASAGAGVLLASADHADLANLCHRVLVFNGGKIVAELHGSDLNEDHIGEICLRDLQVANT